MSQPNMERIELLDIVRGVAILGILLMNIRVFSEPYTAYFNPLVYSDYTGANKIWWAFQYIFADQKFMAIFSMLFGASTAIICDNLAKRGDAVGRTFAKRIFGLFIIGLIHAYLLWPGDILVPYAMCSILPFLFRNAKWTTLRNTGLGLLAFGMIWGMAGNFYLSTLPPNLLESIIAESWHPPLDAQIAEVAAFQGAWSEHFPYRVSAAIHFQTEIFINWGLWRIGGLMLLGLALYRQGFLQGALTGDQYKRLAMISIPVGLGLASFGFYENDTTGWQFPYSMLMANNWNYWGSIITAVGYMSLIGFLLKSTKFRLGFKAFTYVGKAALSNYIFQTIACISIFYGFGLGLFGKLERAETAFVVLFVWALQLALSNYWFKFHSKGPLEDLWHKFTYTQWFGRPAQKEPAE